MHLGIIGGGKAFHASLFEKHVIPVSVHKLRISNAEYDHKSDFCVLPSYLEILPHGLTPHWQCCSWCSEFHY